MLLSNTASLLAASLLYRKDFIGKNDKYAPIAERDNTLQLAIAGKGIYDITGTLSEQMRDQSLQRMNRYLVNWSFYEGRQFINPFSADGEEKTVLNYCEHIVNLSADWLVARGVSFSAPEGNEPIAELINKVWEYNNGSAFLWKLAQFGGICGDAFVYVTVVQKDVIGNDLPKDQWTVKLTALNPAWVHPIWSPTTPDQMLSCVIQFPFMSNSGHMALFTTLITPEKVMTWHNSEKISESENPLGAVNVVHISHQVWANGLFGQGEIDPLWRLNQKLNVVAGTIERIIKYHAEPTTIVYGITVSQLEKGSNKVWSGLPIGGKVENLQLQSDLKATYEWFAQLKKEIAVKAEVPMFLLDSETFKHVSNTSGAALQLLFQPVLSKTERRRVQYRKGLLEVSKLVLLCHEKVIGDELETLADNQDALYSLDVDFTSPLPRDESNELDMAIKKLNGKIWSQAEAIRQVSDVRNIQRLFLELAADQRSALALARENVVASQGGMPAFTSVFLSSPFLSVDMEEIAQGLSDANPQADEGNADDDQQE